MIRVFETDQWDPFRIQANIWEIRPEYKDILKRYNHGYLPLWGIFLTILCDFFINLVILIFFSAAQSASKLDKYSFIQDKSFVSSVLINSEFQVSIYAFFVLYPAIPSVVCNPRLYSVVISKFQDRS